MPMSVSGIGQAFQMHVGQYPVGGQRVAFKLQPERVAHHAVRAIAAGQPVHA
jgi:hypothetical protein